MAAVAILDDFPEIRYLKFFQGTGADPGRCVVDCAVSGSAELTKLPRITTLTINSQNFQGTWPQMRVVKTGRVRNGFMRVVLEDVRWVLRETRLGSNYNERDSLGNVMTGQEKTISELNALFGTATGITVADGTLPTFKPQAKWAGRKASDAWAQLLRETGCRFVYNPVTQNFTLAHGGTGPAPDLSQRLFRPGPPSNIRDLLIYTAPVLYEDKIPVTAKEIDSATGETSPLSVNRLPTTPGETYGQTRFRLWEPDAITHPSATDLGNTLLLDHRAKTHLFDPENPMHERARIIRDSFDRYPHHQPMYNPGNDTAKLIELTGGGRAFLTDHPVLMTPGGFLSTSAEILTSYYIKEENGALKRAVKTKAIDVTATDSVSMVIDWLKPVDSTESDMSGSVWDALHEDVANAIADPLRGDTQTFRLAAPVDLEGSGQIGGMEYELDLRHHRGRIRFSVALNFIPGSKGNIR